MRGHIDLADDTDHVDSGTRVSYKKAVQGQTNLHTSGNINLRDDADFGDLRTSKRAQYGQN